MRSESSSTEMFFSSSIHSSVDIAFVAVPLSIPPWLRSEPSESDSFARGSLGSLFGFGFSLCSLSACSSAARPRAASAGSASRPRRAPPPRLGLGLLGFVGGGSSASAAGSSPPTRPFSAIWPSPTARPEIIAASPRVSPVSGLAVTPTSWPCRTSRPGSRAMAPNFSGSSGSPSMIPPRYSRTSCWRAKVEIALAATTASPLTKVSAIGPSSRSWSSLVPGLLGGSLGEPVLDHAEGGVGLTQAGTKLGRLGDADPAVVDREDRLGLAEPLGDLLDRCCLLFLVHRIDPRNERARSQAGSKHQQRTSPAPVFRAALVADPADGLGQVDGRC